MIYLASPYSHPDPVVRSYRASKAIAYAYQRLQMGEAIFSPVAYGHQFALMGQLPTDHLYWERLNNSFLVASEELRVLKIAGWENSAGVQAEIKFAEEHGLAITEAFVSEEWRKEPI